MIVEFVRLAVEGQITEKCLPVIAGFLGALAIVVLVFLIVSVVFLYRAGLEGSDRRQARAAFLQHVRNRGEISGIRECPPTDSDALAICRDREFDAVSGGFGQVFEEIFRPFHRAASALPEVLAPAACRFRIQVLRHRGQCALRSCNSYALKSGLHRASSDFAGLDARAVRPHSTQV
ncbi:hypothetical protein [Breoghania sp.]|uniref:hypothetical protein n=1 Tax=Breoghania sp. TaxID=2065378 RepID=UPI002619428E|nr:hypothetical protein [Breoghania sp.]MDJ0931678.1 hypothetical protein [Breoghania sp.]